MKIGFIGCGNMAKAMMGGMISSGLVKNDEVIASDAYAPMLENAKKDLGINTTNDNKLVASQSEVVVLAVKPHFYDTVINEIASVINENTIIVSIAPGQTLEKLSNQFGNNTKIIRTMPNTPAMVCEGMTAACRNDIATDADLEKVCSLFNGFGKTSVVKESMMDAVVSVSGSSPAYVYMFIEALADGAVLDGMPRDMAYQFAAQTVYGSAKMVMETKMHPGALKDMVCSPGGTTIEAVRVLEKTGFRSSVMEAMSACVKKARSM